MRPKKSEKYLVEICLFESGALLRGLWCTLWRTCHLMGAGGDRLFGQNKPCFLGGVCLGMCMCNLWGMWECGCICMISICVDESLTDWGLWMPIWPISVWLSSVLHTSVRDYWHINSNQCEYLAIRVCMWVSTAYKAFFSFFLLLKLSLEYVLVVK